MKLHLYLTQIIREKKTGLIPRIIKSFLWLLSYPYQWAVAVRNKAYDREWIGQYHTPVPVVISIGNLVAGGVGKTPITQLIAQSFVEKTKVAILSRGYRSPSETTTVMLTSGKSPLLSAAHVGDEPYLLSENLPKAFVFVGKDRVQSARCAVKEGVELILLDDGMQHRKMARDYEVVVLDSKNPFGHGYFLPRGFLRENPKSLSRADFIILNHVHDSETFEKTKEKISLYSDAPVIGVRYIPFGIYDMQGSEQFKNQGKKALLFCGIAQPDQFKTTVAGMGIQVLGCLSFPDHYLFSTKDLKLLEQKAKALGAEVILCTEKDKVKLPQSLECSLPIFWVKIVPSIIEGGDAYSLFLDRIRRDLNII